MRAYTLVGVGGNAFAIMGYTMKAMRRAGFPKEEIDKMFNEAKSSDYNNLICVCDSYIDKVNEKLGLVDDDEYDDEDDYYEL